MVIYDLNLVGVVVAPDEANPPLVVDANAVLAMAIAPKRLQAIPGRLLEIVQPADAIQIEQLAPCHPLEGTKPGYGSVLK